MGKETKLYIPSNVKTRSEIFEGYGKNEIMQTLLATIVIVIVAFLICAFNKSVSFVVVFILVGIAGSIMCVTKDKYNQSIVDHVKNIIAFSSKQQDYEYKYINEWGDF